MEAVKSVSIDSSQRSVVKRGRGHVAGVRSFSWLWEVRRVKKWLQ